VRLSARLLRHLYRVLLRLYPRSFRVEFGAEMEDVFTEAVAETSARGRRYLVGLLLRELGDWPGALLIVHWHKLQKDWTMSKPTTDGSTPCTGPQTCEEPLEPSPWPEPLLAGLPHALVALFVVIQSYVCSSLSQRGASATENMLGAAFVLAGALVMLIAWRRGWPPWSASWLPYAFLLLAFLLRELLELWRLPLGNWRLMVLLPGLYRNLFLPLALGGAIMLLSLRHRLRFLLAVLPLAVLVWQLALEFVPIRDAIEAAGWLSAAVVAVLIARAGSLRKRTWLTLGLSMGVGLVYTYVGTYHIQFPTSAPAHYHTAPTLLDWWNQLALGTLVTGVLILSPLLVTKLRRLIRRASRTNRLGFDIALAGITLLLMTDLVTAWWFGQGAEVIQLTLGSEATRLVWLIAPAIVGLLLCVVSAAMLNAGLAQREATAGDRIALFAIFALILTPALGALPLLAGVWEMRTVSSLWWHALGLPWLALAVWSIGHRSTRRSAGAEV